MKRSRDIAFEHGRGHGKTVKTGKKRAKTTSTGGEAKIDTRVSSSERKTNGSRAQTGKIIVKTGKYTHSDAKQNETRSGASSNQSLKGVWICARLETVDAITDLNQAQAKDVLVSANDRGRMVVNSNGKCRIRFYGSKDVYEYGQRRVKPVMMPEVGASEHINLPTFRDLVEFYPRKSIVTFNVQRNLRQRAEQDVKEAVQKAKRVGMQMAIDSDKTSAPTVVLSSLSSSKSDKRADLFIRIPKVLLLLVANMLSDLEFVSTARVCRNWNSMLTKRLADRKRDSLFEITAIYQIYMDPTINKPNRLVIHGDFATRLPLVIDTHGQELAYLHKESLYLAYHPSGYVRCISCKARADELMFDMNALRTKENTQAIVREPLLFTDASLVNRLFPDSGYRHVIHVTIGGLPGINPKFMLTEVLMTVESVERLLKRLAPGYMVKELSNDVDYQIVPIEESAQTSDDDDKDSDSVSDDDSDLANSS